MSDLDVKFELRKAEIYTNPAITSAVLPIVYGDLTAGSRGIWEVPCIDTVNHVYAFADHEVMSVANGNSITVYVDGVQTASGWTFSHNNAYESQGTISIITFTSDQGNSKITVKGKGKDDGGGVITDNIIDIIYDFLTVENSFTLNNFDATKKATSHNVFSDKSYEAAGVIDQDEKIWDIVQKMIGSFLGYIYIDGNNKISMSIFDGIDPSQSAAPAIPEHEIEIKTALQRQENLINQCPAYYSYNYSEQQFDDYSSGESGADTASQNIYGAQLPGDDFELFWCRDSTSIGVIQDLVTDKYGFPLWEVEFIDQTLKRLFVDIGDFLAITTREIYDIEGDSWDQRLVEITSINPNFKKSTVTFKTVDTGVTL